MTPKPEKKKCCKQCRQEFKSGLVHCLGITTCPCHQPTEKIPTYVSNGRYIEKDGEPMFPNHPQPTEKVEKCSACPCKSPEAPDEWVGKTHCDCRCHLTPPPQSSEEWEWEFNEKFVDEDRIALVPGPRLQLVEIKDFIRSLLQSREQQARDDERKRIESEIRGNLCSKNYTHTHIDRCLHVSKEAEEYLLNKLQD